MENIGGKFYYTLACSSCKCKKKTNYQTFKKLKDAGELETYKCKTCKKFKK